MRSQSGYCHGSSASSPGKVLRFCCALSLLASGEWWLERIKDIFGEHLVIGPRNGWSYWSPYRMARWPRIQLCTSQLMVGPSALPKNLCYTRGWISKGLTSWISEAQHRLSVMIALLSTRIRVDSPQLVRNVQSRQRLNWEGLPLGQIYARLSSVKALGYFHAGTTTDLCMFIISALSRYA